MTIDTNGVNGGEFRMSSGSQEKKQKGGIDTDLTRFEHLQPLLDPIPIDPAQYFPLDPLDRHQRQLTIPDVVHLFVIAKDPQGARHADDEVEVGQAVLQGLLGGGERAGDVVVEDGEEGVEGAAIQRREGEVGRARHVGS